MNTFRSNIYLLNKKKYIHLKFYLYKPEWMPSSRKSVLDPLYIPTYLYIE